MSENGFKLDINIPQKEITNMAKQVIREIIESQIKEVMENINIEKIILDKIESTTKISKIAENAVKKEMDNIVWNIRGQFHQQMRDILLEEIQKKPLSGNIYLKLNNSDIETDY
jgi:Spy/CpxP family protein refolding chaperone